MKTIHLKEIKISNFKGIKELKLDFTNNVTISGQNASGKTSIFDALTWLLFDKNSLGDAKFAVRPIDENGKMIDNVEINVTGEFIVDDESLTLSKTQKQNWVKHHGDAEKKFEGNVNTFEVDGYPKSEKEYKKIISELIDENIFKLITNPQTFPNMPWKDQRAILMNFVSDIKDVDIASKNPAYEDLIPELEKADSTDDIKAKFLKAKKELNKQLEEYPARIDEINKMKVDIDADELKTKQQDYIKRIADIDKKLDAANRPDKLDGLKEKAMNLQFEINTIYQSENDKLVYQRRAAENEFRNLESKKESATTDIEINKASCAAWTKKINDSIAQRTELGNEYKAMAAAKFDDSKWVFDESTTVCAMCGQKLPESKIAELKANFSKQLETARTKFETDKKNQMQKLISDGKDLQTREAQFSKQVEEFKKAINDYDSQLQQIEQDIKTVNDKINAVPKEPDMSSNAEYIKLIAEYEKVQTEIASTEKSTISNPSNVAELNDLKNDLNGLLEEVNDKLAKVANNSNIDKRIADLEEEQRETSQKVADQERMLFLLDEFIKEKMNIISDSINRHFKLVKFNLFKTYLNGGIEPCCECTYKGINYSNLNTGHRIVAGLDIINSLCTLYEVNAPVFTDNAEGINDYNIPEMACQMVLLKVSDDKKLKLEANR